MDSLIGADPDALEAFAGRLKTAAERFEVVRGEVASDLAHLGWEGEDADGFREEWNLRLSGRLGATIDMLNTACSVLNLNAAQQRWASGEFGAGGGGGLSWSVLGGMWLADEQEIQNLHDWVGNAKSPFDLVGFFAKHAPGEVKALKSEFPGMARTIAGLESTKPVKGLMETSESFDKLGNAFAVFGIGVDIASLRQKPTADAEVGLALNIATVGAMFIPGVGEAVEAVNLAYSFGSLVDPRLADQVVSISNAVADGVDSAVTSAFHTVLAGDAAELHVAEAASRIVTGGVESMVRHLHL